MIDRMDNQKLIFEVSKHQELFDTKHKNYFDSDIKNRIWSNISLKMNYTPEICKARWRNLRTCFVSEIKKANKYARVGKRVKKYIYHDKMVFLLPFLQQNRKPNSHEDNKDLVSEENSKQEHEFIYDNSLIHSTKTTKEFIDLGPGFIDQDEQDQDPISVEETHIENIEIDNEQMETIDIENQNLFRFSKEENDDPLKMFFTTMYKTVRSFPPHLQLASKKAIFHAVTNFEETLLTQPTNNYSNRNLS